MGQAELLLDSRVLLFSLATAAGSGLLFGLVPALMSARPDLAPELKASGVAAGTAAGRARAWNALVTCQIGISLVLVVVGTLLVRSFSNAVDADVGFKRDNVLVLEIPNLGEAGTGQHEGSVDGSSPACGPCPEYVMLRSPCGRRWAAPAAAARKRSCCPDLVPRGA